MNHRNGSADVNAEGGFFSMSDCARLAKCIFFNDQMADMPAMAEMCKLRYCKGRPEDCARWAVASKLGPERVPKDLFPNDMNHAEILLPQHS